MNNAMYDEARGKHEGFAIHFYALPEDMPYDGTNEDGSPDTETQRKIDDGDYVWFVAKVTASRAGICLGVAYLGWCCYESFEQFLRPGDYCDDMVNEAVADARATLATLCKEVSE